MLRRTGQSPRTRLGIRRLQAPRPHLGEVLPGIRRPHSPARRGHHPQSPGVRRHLPPPLRHHRHLARDLPSPPAASPRRLPRDRGRNGPHPPRKRRAHSRGRHPPARRAPQSPGGCRCPHLPRNCRPPNPPRCLALRPPPHGAPPHRPPRRCFPPCPRSLCHPTPATDRPRLPRAAATRNDKLICPPQFGVSWKCPRLNCYLIAPDAATTALSMNQRSAIQYCCPHEYRVPLRKLFVSQKPWKQSQHRATGTGSLRSLRTAPLLDGQCTGCYSTFLHYLILLCQAKAPYRRR